MTQYNSLNVKLSNSQLGKSKIAVKNATEVTIRLSWNIIDDNKTNLNYYYYINYYSLMAKFQTFVNFF